jgi:hypothetical protein
MPSGQGARGIIADDVVITVLSPTEPGILPLEGLSNRPDSQLSWERHFFSRRLRNKRDIGLLGEGRQAAEQFTVFITNELLGLSSLGYTMQEFGEFLYEKVGRISIQLDGEPRTMINLAEFPPVQYFGETPFLVLERKLYFANWVAETAARRRGIGLPVAPLNSVVRALLDEYHVNYTES